jgi:hypothetical protein
MEADTDLLLGDLMQADNIKTPDKKDFVGTIASNMKNTIQDQNDFDEDYETLNLAMDENQGAQRHSDHIKKQLSEI